MFAGVAAGVVYGHGGAGYEFLGEGQLLLVEGLGLVGAPEVDHTEDEGTGPQRHGDQRVDAVLDDLRGAFGVLGEPAGGVAQPGFDDGLAGVEAACLRGGRDELDLLADRVERGVVADPAGGRAAQVGAGLRFLAAEYGVVEVDRDEVREAGTASSASSSAVRVTSRLVPMPTPAS